MKKRMFITTIVMMLVLAIALTTSSLAWFSSANTIVTASAATFTAKSASSNVNLKISDTTGSWGNQIALTSGASATMEGIIPTAALVATVPDNYEFPTTTGVTINGVATAVPHADYKWPARIEFNKAVIGDESNFIIEGAADADGGNKVTDYKNLDKNSAAGYYYDEFYIHNSDTQNAIASLTFKVSASVSATGSDYTCNGYAAFILFDAVRVAAGSTVPDNALEYAGYSVLAYDAGSVESNQVKETAQDGGLLVWVPFAAFSFAVDKTGDTGANNSNDAWQFADLDAKSNGVDFDYNGADITSLKTQAYDALTGDTGFVLNTTNLKALNDKVVNGSGNVTNTNASRDTDSVFTMPAGETFLVAFYYWLDGYTMTEFTDTTVSEIGITINA